MEVTPEKQRAILQHYAEVLRSQEVAAFEREKTTEEAAIIAAVFEHFPHFIRAYGGEPIDGLTMANIHIIEPSKLTEAAGREFEGSRQAGWYQFHLQGVFVLPDKPRLVFFERVVHEMLHFHSFVSLNARQDASLGPTGAAVVSGKLVTPRRMGFSIFDRHASQRLFAGVDEAIIEDLTIRFDRGYSRAIPALKGEIEERERRRAMDTLGDEIVAVFRKKVAGRKWELTLHCYPYEAERKRLASLVTEIVAMNRDRFASEEEVFGVFARAVLTGRGLLDVARLIEATYGRGSFRALGEETKQSKHEPQSTQPQGIDAL